jgi:hypothetical protein
MVTLEQVSRRVFADPSWFVKTVIGMLLMLVPVPLVFGFGYIYRMAVRGRRGESVDLLDWDWGEWRGLGADGLRFLAILLVLGLLPVVTGWVIGSLVAITLAMLPLYSIFSGIAFLPVLLAPFLAAPLTAAGLFRYQRREEFRDAFRVPLLLRMIVGARASLIIPTLAFIGFMVVIPPYALFTGSLVYFYFCSLVFHELESDARRKTSAQTSLRR